MNATDADVRRMQLDANLAEYNRAWAEIAARFSNQLAAFTIFVGGLAGVLAFGKLTDDLSPICLLAPLFIAPVSYIFFDNELQIWRVATYMRTTLNPRIARLVDGTDLLGIDRAAFATKAARANMPFLSFGRWLIFFMPAVAAIVIGLPTVKISGWWSLVLMLDVASVVVLASGIGAAWAEQSTWRRDVAERERASRP